MDVSRRQLVIFTLGLVGLAVLSVQAGEPASVSRWAVVPPDVPLPPPARNIFFPASHTPASAVADPPARGPGASFVLAGSIASADRKAALLEYPDTGRLVWVNQGDEIDGFTLAEVTDTGVIFQMGAQRLALATGRDQAALLAGKRILRGGFEVIGVCDGADEQFALVLPDGAETAQRINLKDRLEGGQVVGIGDDGIVVKLGGVDKIIAVGARFSPAGRVQ